MIETRTIRAAVYAGIPVTAALWLAERLTSMSAVAQWCWTFLLFLVVTAFVSTVLGLLGLWLADRFIAWFTPECIVVPEPLENAVIRSLEEGIDALTTERDNALYERDNPGFRNSPRYRYLDKD